MPAYSPILWIVFYVIFLALNIFGVALSFRVTMIVTLISLAVLVFFWISAIPNMDFSRWALNIAPDGSELPEGNGPLFPMGFSGVLASLAVRGVAVPGDRAAAAGGGRIGRSRSATCRKGIILGMLTLIVSAFMIVLLNPSVIGVGSHKLGSSIEPLLDGFRAIYGDVGVVVLGILALTGLIASFHTILFAQGRQIYSLSRAGYFPTGLSVTHPTYKTPHVAMIVGSIVGLGIMLIIWCVAGRREGRARSSAACCSTWRCSGRCSPTSCRRSRSSCSGRISRTSHRPYVSPLGIPGAVVTIVIGVVTLLYQIRDPELLQGRDLGDRVVRRRDRLLRAGRPAQARSCRRRKSSRCRTARRRARPGGSRGPRPARASSTLSRSSGQHDHGKLTLEELKSEVAAGAIDTVVAAFPDMQGRLMGKRFHAQYLRRRRLRGDAWLQLSARRRHRHGAGAGLQGGELGKGLWRLRPQARSRHLAPDAVARRRPRSSSATCSTTTPMTTVPHSPRAILKKPARAARAS